MKIVMIKTVSSFILLFFKYFVFFFGIQLTSHVSLSISVNVPLSDGRHA